MGFLEQAEKAVKEAEERTPDLVTAFRKAVNAAGDVQSGSQRCPRHSGGPRRRSSTPEPRRAARR